MQIAYYHFKGGREIATIRVYLKVAFRYVLRVPGDFPSPRKLRVFAHVSVTVCAHLDF
jgi:hypothetical protein